MATFGVCGIEKSDRSLCKQRAVINISLWVDIDNSAFPPTKLDIHSENLIFLYFKWKKELFLNQKFKNKCIK